MSEPWPAFCSLGLFCLLLFLPFSFAAPAAAAEPPRYYLSIAFQMEEGLVWGISRIELPAGTGAKVYLADLHLGKVIVNGQEVAEAAPEEATLQVEALEGPQQIIIEYHKHITPGEDGLVSREGITLLGAWHPLLLEQDALFELTATIPDDFEAVSEADEIQQIEAPAGKRLRFRFPQPVPAIHLAAGPYVMEKVPFGEGKELYTYFFPEDREIAASYRERALGYLERYEREIGPFPYQRFSVVENRLPTGFAMPTFTLLGQTVVRLPFITETSLGHEVLHQWFGNAVAIAAEEGNWAEGLTTYLADHAFAGEEGKGREFRKDQLIKYESYIHPDHTLSLKEFVGIGGIGEVREEDLRAIGYAKSGMLFHMLKNRVGEEAFSRALQDFYSRMLFRSASWQDLIDSFQQTAGEDDLTLFFAQWLTRKDIPSLGVGRMGIASNEGQLALAFDLLQQTSEPYQLLLPVLVETAQGTVRQVVEVTEQETPVLMPVPALPRQLVLDPDYDLMRHLAPPELPPVWSRFQGAPRKLIIMDPEDEALYQPLLEVLAPYQAEVKDPGEVTDLDLASASLLFLGTASAPVRTLFASPSLPETGFAVEVRPNPLHPGQVAVLTAAANAEEVELAAGKLRRYGKYSSLHFKGGRLLEKRVAASEEGQQFKVLAPPLGMATQQTLSFEEIADRLAANRVVYVGENHTTYEDHLLQLRVIQALYHRDRRLAIGMEMFTHPSQEALDQFVAGEIDEWAFLKKSHYFERWGFDYRLYREILDFARQNRIPVIALNLEKEIVSKVFKQGVSALEKEAREKLPPERALDLPGYRERLESVFTMHGRQGGPPAEGFSGFLQAQALWDETMAQTIAGYLEAHPEERMVVLAGKQHVVKDSGIPPRVARRLPVEQAVVINSEARISEPAQSDFVLFSPATPLPGAPLLGVALKEEQGLLTIEELTPHGPANAAGLQPGDVILALDDEPVRSVEDLKIVMLYREKGETVRVRLFRQRKFLPDQQLEIAVTL